MISAKTDAFATLLRKLNARALVAGLAHGEAAIRQRKRDPSRWRDAHLLWPQFTKGLD